MNFGFFLFGGAGVLAILFAIITGISVAGVVIATFATIVTTFVKTFGIMGVAIALMLSSILRWMLK